MRPIRHRNREFCKNFWEKKCFFRAFTVESISLERLDRFCPSSNSILVWPIWSSPKNLKPIRHRVRELSCVRTADGGRRTADGGRRLTHSHQHISKTIFLCYSGHKTVGNEFWAIFNFWTDYNTFPSPEVCGKVKSKFHATFSRLFYYE